ncbi:UNVERIFIED_CONTAM: hypothetical protein GTU68_042992 [Idotea baltica]|nr:hypothetical protein [Idotea baltica]
MVVNLTGLLQTDDRIALQEITRQLNIDDDTTTKFGSFAENLNFILNTLQSGNRKSSKPIIFILDEFDLFCHHRNQTLLYNLFDIAQSAQAPLCVIGLTTRLDVIELLEKRVKSRFSHRQIFLFPQEKFDVYLQVAKELLKVKEASISKDVVSGWNKSVEEVLSSSEVIEIFQKRFCLSRNIRHLKAFLLMAVARLDSETPTAIHRTFQKHFSHRFGRLKTKMLEGLSVLQLSLLITMKHLYAIYDGEPFNFEMVHRQYLKFGEKHSSMSSYERPVVFKAYDQLEGLELIRPVDQSQNRVAMQREYRLMQLLLLPIQIDEAINRIPHLPTFLLHWCSSNVL